jgi:hypothetical protein
MTGLLYGYPGYGGINHSLALIGYQPVFVIRICQDSALLDQSCDDNHPR